MGVWERSPRGIEIALENDELMAEFRSVLPDLSRRDIAGSPYCVRDYRVDAALGGPEGLKVARDALRKRGMKLIVDFVPNHVAPDHPWVNEHPEYFIGGTASDIANDPESWFQSESGVMARGLVIALFVGLAGGLYPALRGAFLLPTEAIRHE